MSYMAYETGVMTGAPIELLHFEHGNGADNWYFTSADEDIVYDGDTYTAIALKRSAYQFGSDMKVGTLRLSVPRDNAIALLFLSYTPSDPIWLTVRRKHRDDAEAVVAWLGKVRSVDWKGAEAVIECLSILSTLKKFGNRYRFQMMCNHMLGEVMCPIDLEHDHDSGEGDYDLEEDFKKEIEVTDTDDGGLKLLSADLSYNGENAVYHTFFQAGYIVSDATGERRFIIEHDGSPAGADAFVKILQPFSAAAIADGTFFVYAGCNRSKEMCLEKFGSAEIFGGFPFMPIENPFAFPFTTRIGEEE